MDIKAAIVRGQGQPFELASLQLDALRPDEVRVRLVATGVCHTDAIVRHQVYPTPLPAVLGHEGAGIVEAVGSEVKLTLAPPSRRQYLAGSCTRAKSACPSTASSSRRPSTTSLSDALRQPLLPSPPATLPRKLRSSAR